MTQWSVPTILKERRERLGLSQADVAARLSVTKGMLSLIEGGKRTPTEDQIAILSSVLRVPRDLLELAPGRLPHDVQLALDLDAAGVVAAVRQRIEAQAVSYPTEPQVPFTAAGSPLPVERPTIPERIDAVKTSTSYRAHSYHTKVPPEAIIPFVEAYTRPGELVFDPFCGSGMTGVAALRAGRNALLSDLSPSAVHIARNYTAYCDPAALSVGLSRVEAAVAPTMEWLYRPVGSDDIVEYTTWSDVYRCPQCTGRILYWDVVQKNGASADGVECPRCCSVTRKADLEWIGEEPVQSHVSRGSNRIHTHRPTPAELSLIADADSAPIPYWTPNVAFGSDREMWRAGHRSMGIHAAGDFFTRRNLHALAALRHAIVGQSEGRVREALMFAFTAAVNRASRRYQWNAKRPTNVMTGTLYISSLRYEWNVWSLFRRKAADVLRYYKDFPKDAAQAQVFQRSATDLGCIPDGAVDLVFMDPPFGANIFYADASLLWDAWLGHLTDTSAEIVVNKHRSTSTGGKTLDDYGDLMCQAFSHARRVLKPDGRAVLAFSNSDDAVWEAVRKALDEAGFATESVHMLYKGQPSIKGVKGVTGKENVTTFDLMLCLANKAQYPVKAPVEPASEDFVDAAIRHALVRGGRTDEIYSAVVQAALAGGRAVAGITMPYVAERCAALGAREVKGRWTFAPPSSQADVDFVSGYIAAPSSVPVTEGGEPVRKPAPATRVQGGRNSALYTAHSYHTKVPPEAIKPFIEHYTKPGDVVLDPFCGSGMTGVAAALAGRRAVLNDLSPAAVHLAWNHTRDCSPEALRAGFDELDRKIGPKVAELYSTRHGTGEVGLIHWTMWSTRHRCPHCRKEFLLWDAIDRKTGRVGRTVECTSCGKEIKRSGLEALGSVPAWISYETEDGRRHEKPASADDIRHALSFSRDDIRDWYPRVAIGKDREMYIRCALGLQNVGSVADFYTARNLQALALIWREIQAVPDDRTRRALAFAFTNTAWHGTRMRRFNARGGQRPLTGTLYIPQLSSEANVLEVMRNKIEQLARYYRVYRPLGVDPPSVLLGSATNLVAVADESVDYVFTDPPFGSNIFYADCSLIWEAWLGRLTDQSFEAVVNRSLTPEKGGKTLQRYGELIGASLREIARVLKDGGWATVVFHNTDGAVWQAIRDAADEAGFTFHEAASLDRQQQSHKGYKGRSGEEDVAHFDVIFNLQKRGSGEARKTAPVASAEIDLKRIVEEVLKDPAIARHGAQGIHAEVMRRLASQGSAIFVDYAEVRDIFEALRATKGKLRLAG
ncbi:DNA methyltransferase [Salinarimonas soli]|uniref:site-specific DNA-methyltransferase (adenine-specific) n=1 Tax=Salinarimonas soli TaxID=1638099 RepID=A0A5B2V7V8_9HYPH|nr:DNA methyltransferase [Salinarimonas soli]KAA2234906.1 helix-turn-helix domain-containing protein [Salinarimonas soli]